MSMHLRSVCVHATPTSTRLARCLQGLAKRRTSRSCMIREAPRVGWLLVITLAAQTGSNTEIQKRSEVVRGKPCGTEHREGTTCAVHQVLCKLPRTNSTSTAMNGRPAQGSGLSTGVTSGSSCVKETNSRPTLSAVCAFNAMAIRVW